MRTNWTAILIVAIGSLALVWLQRTGHADAAIVAAIVGMVSAAQAQKAIRKNYTRVTDKPAAPAEAPTTFTKEEAPTSPSKPPSKAPPA